MIQRLKARFYLPLVTVWLTLSLTGAVLTWMTWRRLAATVERGVQLAAQNDRLDGVFTALLNAETGERGYILTGKESYLTPFHEAENAFPTEFQQLTAFAAQDPEMIQLVVSLRGLAELKLEEIRQTVRIRRSQGFEAAVTALGNDDSKMTMDKIRTLVERMRLARPNLLTREGEATRAQLDRAISTSLVAALIGVGAGVFAFRLARISLGQEQHARELAEAKLRAEERSEQKSAFLANVSHEIRTPMNSILGFSELLATELHQPRLRHYLASLRASAHSLLQLINDVLDMSKIEAGVLRLQPEPADPREVCGFIRTVFAEQALRKGLRLTCIVADDVPHALLFDRTRLRQILVNLVGNAVKFTHAGEIKVTFGHQSPDPSASHITLLIDVEDTGCGIPRELRDSIFEPFVQIHGDRPEGREGTGLGLAIVRRLVEAMGGDITLASVLNQGTTFHLRLPNLPVSIRLPTQSPDDTLDVVEFNLLRPSRLLVVDDHPANRDLLAATFAPTHHELHFASNGEMAVQRCIELLPDLVLMDLRMPVLDGRAALDRIRAHPELQLLPIIAVSASAAPDDVTAPETSPAFSGFLKKPFTRKALFAELALFLPRQAVPSDPFVSTPLSTASSSSPQDPRPSWSDLALRLRNLQTSDWTNARESLSVRETRSFALQLETLARQSDCPALADYSATLLRHCDAYVIPEIESTLGAFPDLVAEIHRRASSVTLPSPTQPPPQG